MADQNQSHEQEQSTGDSFQGKPAFNVWKGITVSMNTRQARDLVELFFDLEDLEPHLFAFAEQINNKLPNRVEHPSQRQAS